MDVPNTLSKSIEVAKKKALADVYGFSEHPFTAVQFRKTLPLEWQEVIEMAIVEIYHNT